MPGNSFLSRTGISTLIKVPSCAAFMGQRRAIAAALNAPTSIWCYDGALFDFLLNFWTAKSHMTRGHVQHAPPSSLSTETEEKELNLGLTCVWRRSLFTCAARVRITQHFTDCLVSAELRHLVTINSPTSGKTSANVSFALLIRERQQTSSPAKIQNWTSKWRVRQTRNATELRTVLKVCAFFSQQLTRLQ